MTTSTTFRDAICDFPLAEKMEIRTGEDLRLMRRQITSGTRWGISPEVREELPLLMWKLVTESPDLRAKIHAARMLVAMEGQNQRDQLASEPQVNVNVNVDTSSMTLEDIERRIAELESGQ